MGSGRSPSIVDYFWRLTRPREERQSSSQIKSASSIGENRTVNASPWRIFVLYAHMSKFSRFFGLLTSNYSRISSRVGFSWKKALPLGKLHGAPRVREKINFHISLYETVYGTRDIFFIELRKNRLASRKRRARGRVLTRTRVGWRATNASFTFDFERDSRRLQPCRR